MDPDAPLTYLLIGVVLNWAFYGVLTVQTYLYYIAFPHDKKWTKAVVYAIYVLELVHTIFMTWVYRSAVKYLVLAASTDMESAFRVVDWSTLLRTATVLSFLIPLIGGLVSFITNLTYAYRIHVVTSSRVLTWVIIVLNLLQFIFAVVFACMATWAGRSSQHPESILGNQIYNSGQITGLMWLSLSVISDVSIAVTMVYSLSREKILSKEIRQKVSQLLRLTIETGSATAIMNIITLILLATARWTGTLYLATLVVLSKMYGNAMMVLLNNRISIPGSRRESPTLDAVWSELTTLSFQTTQATQHMHIGVFPEPKTVAHVHGEATLTTTTDNRNVEG
ncbi:hypothetical protein AMATHDRAFT_69523 [Amanita thiersii Skay4041]|uniref:DUF6534 domain-containing protein n=1 Tax=Amanita thiersii Skay4041 TaxID=703135 RepID=A0A2A9NFV9_9AGAR|nr:hypothetical protein AMATHDRAFT_69523 [Amanita thiersii Skay4041]